MKILLVVFVSFVAVLFYAAFRLWLFFRRMVRPAQRNYQDHRNNNQDNQHIQIPKADVLYSNDDVVVLKGEAKDKNNDNKNLG